MFGRNDTGNEIERLCQPFNWQLFWLALVLLALFAGLAWGVSSGTPVRSLGSRNYSNFVIFWVAICCSILISETWRLLNIWQHLKILLDFLDRLPLRRTMAALHGFSWGGVWRMSGNVLEVRYEILSRQIESMNHTIASLDDMQSESKAQLLGISDCVKALAETRTSVMAFANWYAENFKNPDAGNLQPFECTQANFAKTAGLIFGKLLVPTWFLEGTSLVQVLTKGESEVSHDCPMPAKDEWLQNAEEFVCLVYLAFIQNILGRLRTVSFTIVALFLAATLSLSTYPFDPRQGLSAFLVVILLLIGAAMFKVYAEMHRDATLSHVTNTKPGELGTDFWVKLLGFGLAPVVGIIARIFPSVSDFLFSWLQPSISSLK
jgi:hypothetical protein